MAPRVVVLSLASDFGCQVQITNMEDHILDVLGLIDLSFWQLASSGDMPADYDVAIIEGAVTTDGARRAAQGGARDRRASSIAIGACAVTGGIPAMANLAGLEERYAAVYGDGTPAAPGRRAPLPIGSVIDVDYHVPGCPIDTDEFMRVLSRALRGLQRPRAGHDHVRVVQDRRERVLLRQRGRVPGSCHAGGMRREVPVPRATVHRVPGHRTRREPGIRAHGAHQARPRPDRTWTNCSASTTRRERCVSR